MGRGPRSTDTVSAWGFLLETQELDVEPMCNTMFGVETIKRVSYLVVWVTMFVC